MYMDEPPKDGNIPDFNISKIDICPFRAYQRSFRLFQSDFSKDIHQRSRLLCFTQNDHTGQTGFKICPFLKWALYWTFASGILPSPKGANVNNRGWNDRREWNLRIADILSLSSPKGANRSKTGCGSPPLGTGGYLRNLNYEPTWKSHFIESILLIINKLRR